MARCIGKEQVPVTSGGVVSWGAGMGTAVSTADAMGLSCTIQVDPVKGGSVRMWPDGSSPTTAAGFVMQSGDTMVFDLEINKLAFIAISADVTLNVLYWKD